ncbi:MAG: putative quinol monooxygenase, partial [Pseudomonadota bacterium]
ATFKDGALEALRPAMEAMIAASRAEPGCIDYRYGLDVSAPNEMVVVEYWEDWAALEAHFETPHMADWRAALAGVVVSRDIKACEAGPVKAL